MRIVSLLRRNHAIEAGSVGSGTDFQELLDIQRRLGEGAMKYLVVDGLMTAGLDTSSFDTVAALRPTLSSASHFHMALQGAQLYPNKENCLVLDFVANALRHGPAGADPGRVDHVGMGAHPEGPIGRVDT